MNRMSLKIQTVFLLIVLATGPLFADEQKPDDTGPQAVSQTAGQETLKARQQFNRLKRSTRNIYKVTMRSSVTYKLQTALGYVSTIDLPEKALKVFVGDQDLFKVEVYERQVLIKPITDELDSRTNLVIITGSGRLTFDVSVGPASTADFVLDFRLPQDDESLVRNAFDEKIDAKTKELEKDYQAKEEKLEKKAEELSEKKITQKVAAGAQTVELKKSEGAGEVQINLLSISRVADKAYLRFSVLNYSKVPYKPLKVIVGIMTYEKKFLRSKEDGFIEIPSVLELPAVINPDAYEYGVLAFDYRPLRKNEKPVFRISEDAAESRNIEIKGFGWLS